MQKQQKAELILQIQIREREGNKIIKTLSVETGREPVFEKYLDLRNELTRGEFDVIREEIRCRC